MRYAGLGVHGTPRRRRVELLHSSTAENSSDFSFELSSTPENSFEGREAHVLPNPDVRPEVPQELPPLPDSSLRCPPWARSSEGPAQLAEVLESYTTDVDFYAVTVEKNDFKEYLVPLLGDQVLLVGSSSVLPFTSRDPVYNSFQKKVIISVWPISITFNDTNKVYCEGLKRVLASSTLAASDHPLRVPHKNCWVSVTQLVQAFLDIDIPLVRVSAFGMKRALDSPCPLLRLLENSEDPTSVFSFGRTYLSENIILLKSPPDWEVGGLVTETYLGFRVRT